MDLPVRSFDLARPGVAPPLLSSEAVSMDAGELFQGGSAVECDWGYARIAYVGISQSLFIFSWVIVLPVPCY